MHRRWLALVTTIVASAVCLTAQDQTAAGARPEPSAGGVVTGVVRYASGKAIADVRVSLIVPGERSARTAWTGADGAYRFEGVPAGEYQASVAHAGAVAKRIGITAGSELKDIDFSIPDGRNRRVVAGRVVMNAASKGQPMPARLTMNVAGGVGLLRTDGTLVVPLAPGDQRVVVTLPSNYFLDSATLGSANLYSMEGDGRRLSSAVFTLTVRPEPEPMPELVITLGFRR